MRKPFIERRSPEGQDDLSRFPDWREIVAIVLERIWIAAAVLISVCLFTFVRVSRETPYYRSTAVLLVQAQIPRLVNYQDALSINVRSLEYFNTVINTLHSREIIGAALQSSNMASHTSFLASLGTGEARIDAASTYFKTTPIEKSRLIHVTVEHPDPAVASDFANAVAESYIQKDLDSRMQASLEAVEWLRERSEEYRQKLERGLAELQNYRESTKSVSLEADQNIVLAKLKALNETLTSAQTDRIDAESRWKSIKSQLDAKAAPELISAQLQEVGVAEAAGKLNAQRAEIARLRQRYTANHPDLQQAIDYESTLARNFDQAIATAVVALQSRYETLKQREASLLDALRAQEKESFELDRKLVRYNELKRNAESDEQIYQSMVARMKETSISGSMPGEIIQLAERAQPAKSPYRPRLGQEMFKGLLIGLAASGFLIFMFYYSDHRFRRNEEVERVLGLPVLAALPRVDGKTEHDRGMTSYLEPSGEVSEAFRTLRATIQLQDNMNAAQVFMITSAQPGDGKSLVSSNLAISFAMDGRKTLLIGADLRRPVLHRVFNRERPATGLAEFLKGKAQWNDTRVAQLVPNLDVVFAGDSPSNPAETLGGDMFGQLIQRAKADYERIIIDAPPILGISDALVLLPHADGVLFVVRYGATHSMGASFALRRIKESKAPCFGAVLNSVDMRSVANNYYYRRYGGYAYRAYRNHPNDGTA